MKTIIPNEVQSGLSFSDLPARSTNVNVAETLKVMGGARWKCINKRNKVDCGNVNIWWTTPGLSGGADAKWACDNWISCCGAYGGCFGRKLS